MTSSSVLKLVSAYPATRSTWLSIGERMRVSRAVIEAARNVRRFSTRESPSPVTPARSHTLAISAEPSVALVTPVTEIPRAARVPTSASALCSSLARSISSRGVASVSRRSRSPREIGRVDQFSGADYGNRELKKLCAQARGRATILEIIESVHHRGKKSSSGSSS